MQELSFEFKTATLDLFGYAADVMVYTFENAYGLDAEHLAMTKDAPDEKQWNCTGLLFAGGQEKTAAHVCITCKREASGAVCVAMIVSDMPHAVRCVKLTLHGLAPCRVKNKLDLTEPKVTEQGLRLPYPEGWRTLDTPMLVLEDDDGKLLMLRSLDMRVSDKTFVLARRGDAVDAELIWGSYGAEVSTVAEVPAWEIRRVSSVEEAYTRQTEHICKAYGLTPWEQRMDVPQWAKEISLVAAIHGQHWTGYIFNDYAKILRTLEWLAKRIEGKRVLAFLPGWEGRYYWKYGSYQPDERMGGSKGFHRLADGARELGIHLMPMYGINMVNRDLPGFEQWGKPSETMDLTGGKCVGSVDWDGSRHYQHGSNAVLNPGAPQWQNMLTSQVGRICNEYGIDAAFLDIAACWYNDPHFPRTNEGVKQLCDKLRGVRKGLLVAGEAWYDGLTPAMPVVHSGHTDGPMHYHDALNEPFFGTWMREFSHLCLGDPGHGSTGVHELGINRVDWKAPLRKSVWPTATIVDDTLERAPERLEEIIHDAKQYAERFL